ncbi:MAG: beta strand repeat-containing protein, partial [Planctomycetota bacterium]
MAFAAATVTAVSGSNGTYIDGETIDVTVNFSEAVTVSGSPQLSLAFPTGTQTATYASGSGSATLTFQYTIQSGDQAFDLDYVATDSLSLNGGSIVDAGSAAADLTLPTPGDAGSLSANAEIHVNVVRATSIDATDDTYGIDDSIEITLAFSAPVVVDTTSGVPSFSLSNGGTATYQSGSGSDQLVFVTTVQEGQSSSDLNTTSPITRNGATITTSDGINADLVLPSLASAANVVVDASRPVVTAIQATPSSARLGLGDSITISLTFSEPVNVTGSVSIPLSSGGSALYASGSGTTTLSFTYTVAAGQDSGDLDDNGVIDASGGSLADLNGNAADLDLETVSLANGNAIVVDTTAPSVQGIGASSGAYGPGASIAISIGLNEAVIVDTSGGTPTLGLSNGASASYSSGSGSAALVFTYTVAASDTDTSELSNAGSFDLSGAAIADLAGNALSNSFATNLLSNAATIGVDTTAPSTVNKVTSATPAPAPLIIGDQVDIDVHFPEAVGLSTLDGVPTLALDSGGAATFVQAVDADTLRFRYTVAAGESSSDLDYTATDALALNNATLSDAVGNQTVSITLPAPASADSLAGNRQIVVDGQQPQVTAAAFADTAFSDPAQHGSLTDLTTGDVLVIQLSFSETVTVTGTPQLPLNSGGRADYSSGSGSATLLFTYTIGSGEEVDGGTPTGDPLTYPADAGLQYAGETLLLSGGMIEDDNGNAADTDLGGAPLPGNGVTIDTRGPTISSITSNTANGTYQAGDSIAIALALSEPATVTAGASITLSLDTGSTVTWTADADSTDTTSVPFSYTVGPGDTSSDLTVVEALSSGTITDAAGNAMAASLALPSGENLADNAAIVIGGSVDPGTASVSNVTANPTVADLTAGQEIAILVRFSQPVTVDGLPRLRLDFEDQDREAIFTSQPDGQTLRFVYTTQRGDSTDSLEYADADAEQQGMQPLTLNGGRILDADGDPADLTFPSVGAIGSLTVNTDITVDTLGPQVLSVRALSDQSVIYGAGEEVEIEIVFDEPVFLSSARLALATGRTSGTTPSAQYVRGNGTDTILLVYVVQTGDQSRDLAYTSSSALTGTIRDDLNQVSDNALPLP